MALIRVFTINNCPRCRMTINYLKKNHLKFTVINLDHHPQYRKSLRDEGWSSAPVVYFGVKKWCGFRPDKLRSLKKEMAR